MNSSTLADYLEIWGMEGDFCVFADGSLGFGLSLVPLDISCWSDDRINALSGRLGQFLNGIPDGTSLQFVYEIGKGNSKTIHAHQKLGCENGIAGQITDLRARRLLQTDADGSLPKYDLKLFVRRPFSEPLLRKPKLFSKTSTFNRLSKEQLEREVFQCLRLKETILQGLKELGIESEVLDADQILSLIYHQWNPRRAVLRPKYDPEDVRSSLLFTDVSISARGFSLADRNYRVFSLKTLPDSSYAAMASHLRELPFGSRLFLTIEVPHQQSELDKLKTQRRIAFAMARGKSDGVSDLESESKFHDLEGLIEQMVAEGEKVFKVALNVVISSANNDELDFYSSELLMRIRALGGAEAMEESIASFDIFSQIAIPNARAKERIKLFKTSNLCDFLPLFSPWTGHQVPRMLLRTRLGSLMSFDPFSSTLTNYNQIVSGGSGSGKSFLANILLTQMLKENPKIFVIDIGGSYKKMCSHLDGQYIPLSLSSGISMNPFDLPLGEALPSNEKIKFLLGMVELITKEDGVSRLPKLERAEIEEAIQAVYRSELWNLSSLRSILSQHPLPEIQRFARILSPWCGNTPYGQFVDAPTSIELNKPIVVFDLKGLESNPDLQSLALFIITDFVWREVQKDPHRIKFLVFDECWKLLGTGAGLSFIEEVFRTFRKYYASAIAISQNIDDFATSEIAGAILSNSATKWILSQRGADPKRLQEVLDLNPNEVDLLASLTQERGKYSEAFLIAGEQRCITAIEATPLEYWIATTHPQDLAKLDQVTKENSGLSRSKVLSLLAETFPKGASVNL